MITDRDGRVLLATRPDGRPLAGLWELPGGKVDPGETPEDALRRELSEELAVTARIGEPITFAADDQRRNLLLFYSASIDDGTPRPLEGQEIAWVAVAELDSYPLPPADRGLVHTLQERAR